MATMNKENVVYWIKKAKSSSGISNMAIPPFIINPTRSICVIALVSGGSSVKQLNRSLEMNLTADSSMNRYNRLKMATNGTTSITTQEILQTAEL